MPLENDRRRKLEVGQAAAFTFPLPSPTAGLTFRLMKPTPFLLLFTALAIMTGTAVSSTARAEEIKGAPPGVDKLPAIPQLPDPFLFPDGSRVKTAADWGRRREQIKSLILDYEYGHLPPSPGNVAGKVKENYQNPDGSTEQNIHLTFGPEGQSMSLDVFLTVPAGKGPFPVIVKGDLCWERVKSEIVADVVKRGYALAEFDRTRIAPDDKTYRAAGIYKLHPEADGGDLAAWAWGFSRVIDYLATLDSIDKTKIIVTGHSRGGKAGYAVGTGHLDERAAMVVPNGSPRAERGCFRARAESRWQTSCRGPCGDCHALPLLVFTERPAVHRSC